MLDQKYFWVLAVLLMSGCCPCHQMQIGDKYCLLIQDLNRYLNTGCTVKVIDVSKNLQDFNQLSWSCPEQLVAVIPLQRKNFCLELGNLCPNAVRRLIVLSQISTHHLKKINFEYCSLNMIFIYFGFNVTSFANIDKSFNDVYISVNCRFLLVQETPGGYQFWEIYRENENSPLHFQDIGQWNEYNRNFSKDPLLPNIYQQRKKFENVTLKVGYVDLQHTSRVIILENKTEITSGYFITKWVLITKYLNIKSIYSKNNFTSQIIDVTSKSMNVAMPMLLESDVYRNVNILYPFMSERYILFMRSNQIPKYSSVQWYTYLKPFQRTLWFSICLILFCFVFLEFVLYSRHSIRGRFLIEIMLNKISRLCIQTPTTEAYLESSASGKILLIIFILYSQIINLSYSSCITSFFLSSSYTLAFNDLEGLLNFGGFKIHTLPVRSFMELMKNSQDPILIQVYTEYLKPERNNFPRNKTEIFYNINNIKKYAYICPEKIGTAYISNTQLKLTKMSLMKQQIFYSCIINKYLPYQRFLNNKFLVLQETGINQHLIKEYFGEEIIEEDEENQFNSLDIEIILLPLIILILFYFISFNLLILERIIFCTYLVAKQN